MFKSSLLKAAVAASFLVGGSAAMADAGAPFASDLAIGASGITTVQSGIVYGYSSCGGGLAACAPGAAPDWNYYYSRPDWYVAEFDEWGLLDGTNGVPPSGYFGVLMTAPKAVGATVAPKVNVSDSKYMLVKMANHCGQYGCPGVATTFTVVLSNGAGSLSLYSDPHFDASATAICSADVALNGPQGDGLPVGPGLMNRIHAMFTYKVNLSSFKCSKGTLSKALSALTSVSVEVRANKNPAELTNLQNTGNEMEFVSVSRVDFAN